MKLHASLLFVLVVGLVIVGCSLPRHSAQSIRQRILSETPVGSSYAAVLDYAKKQGWSVTQRACGYQVPGLGHVPSRVVGKRTIEAYLGGYSMIFHVDVVCDWAFDNDNRLIDVFVDKQTDAL